MKKFLPFIFPLIALALVAFLAFRWYSDKTARPEGKISEFAAGAKIEDITQSELTQLRQPVKDLASVELKGSDAASGQVRYEVKGDKVLFSVTANLPALEQGEYQVWLKEVNGDARRKAFMLKNEKVGFTGSASITAEALPFEVVVSREVRTDDSDMELVLLRGTLKQEVTENTGVTK